MGQPVDWRGVWSDVQSPDVWVLGLSLATPLTAGAAAVTWAAGTHKGDGVSLALALVAGVVVLVDIAFLICFSSDRRWPAGLFGSLVAGGLLIAGFGLSVAEWTLRRGGSGLLGVALLAAGAAVLFLVTVNSDASSSKLELRRGAVTLAAALLTAVIFVAVLVGSWPDVAWVRFVLVLGASVIALRLIAAEWSRVMLVASFLAVVIGLGGVLVQLGYAEERSEHREELQAATRAVDRLEVTEGATRKELAARAATELTALGGVLAAYPTPDPTPDPAAPGAAPVPGVDGQTTVEEIITSLSETPPDLDTATQALHRVEALPVAASLVAWRTAAQAAAAKAIESQKEAAEYRPERNEVDTAITDARRARSDSKHPGAYAWRVARVDLELARYRAAVTRAQKDADAAKALALNGAAPVRPTVSLLEALRAGPRAVAASFNGDQPIPLVGGPLGWLLVAAAGLVFWAALLRSNARQLAGPVRIDKVSGFEIEKTNLNTVFRIAVLRNLPEPGAAPGSIALQPVTDLLDVAAPEGWGSKAVALVTKMIGQSYGYIVDVEIMDVEEPDEPTDSTRIGRTGAGAGTTARALVRVKDIQTSRTLTTEVLDGPTRERVVRSAGIWASGYILGRSTRIPSWASWNVDTASALSTATEHVEGLEDLRSAARSAPNSGLLLYLLSNAYELEGRPIEALSAAARAVASHPRYAIAQYRLAAGMAMMSEHHATEWSRLTRDRRQPVGNLFRQVADRRHLGSAAETAATALADEQLDEETAKTRFHQLSDALFEDLIQRTRFLPFLASSLRRSERDQILMMALPFGPAQGARRRRSELARSAQLVPHPSDARGWEQREALMSEAVAAQTSWQVTYNAACAKCRDNDLPAAMGMLEACLTKRDVHQLSGTWVEKDPDLRALRSWPRFRAFTSQITRGAEDA